MILTDLQVSQGYYTLPNVDRPINPSDPLGLWDVYSQDLAEQEVENKMESHTETSMANERLSYADVVKNKAKKDTKVNKGMYSTIKVVEHPVKQADAPTKMRGTIQRKRCVEEAFGEDFIAQQPKKTICLSEKVELETYCVKDDELSKPKKISLQQYRQRKAIKVARRKPMDFETANMSNKGKRSIEEAFGEDFIAQQPKKIICLSEKTELESYCVIGTSLAKSKKITLQQYRERKALKVVIQKPVLFETTQTTKRKRNVEEAFGEDFIALHAKKVVCLSERAELEKFCLKESNSAYSSKKKVTLQQYRQRKALRVVRRSPLVSEVRKKSYAEVLKSKPKPKGRYAGKIEANGKLHSSTRKRRPLCERN